MLLTCVALLVVTVYRPNTSCSASILGAFRTVRLCIASSPVEMDATVSGGETRDCNYFAWNQFLCYQCVAAICSSPAHNAGMVSLPFNGILISTVTKHGCILWLHTVDTACSQPGADCCRWCR